MIARVQDYVVAAKHENEGDVRFLSLRHLADESQQIAAWSVQLHSVPVTPEVFDSIAVGSLITLQLVQVPVEVAP